MRLGWLGREGWGLEFGVWGLGLGLGLRREGVKWS